MSTQTPIISTHRGRRVALGRPNVSPRVLGVAGVRALDLLNSFPTAADTRDWLQAAVAQCNGQFGMMLNDKLGCCTCADGPGHCTQIWSANNGTMQTPPDSAVLGVYERVCGYNPADPSTDQGGVETTVLAAWQAGIDGFAKLDIWIPVNPQNVEHCLTAIERYGAMYSGVALPLSAQNQAVWDVDDSDPVRAAAGSWGGHAVSWSKYSRATKQLACVTWGMEQGASFAWLGGYCDEAYAMLCSTLWAPNGTSPLGDSVAVLKGNIAGLTA